jgi:hypothetical protein
MSATAVARLSNPGEILAVLPSLCGFRPDESLVVMSLRGPRKRLGLTARVDLPPERDEPAVARLLADRMVSDGARAVVIAVYSEHGGRPGLVDALRGACDSRRLVLHEALHVQGSRWTSYTCSQPCCPDTGTPVPAAPPVLGLVQAEQVASGRAQLASRQDLVRSLAPPSLLAAASADQRLDRAEQLWRHTRVERGLAASRRATSEHARVLLDRVSAGGEVTPRDAALLAVGVSDVVARDQLATLVLTREDELLSLLVQVARQTTPPWDAPVCALLALTAYAKGDGATANVALDRALSGTPDHSLSLLLRQWLDAGLPPEHVRRLTRATRRELQGRGAPGRASATRDVTTPGSPSSC